MFPPNAPKQPPETGWAGIHAAGSGGAAAFQPRFKLFTVPLTTRKTFSEETSRK